MTTYQLKYHARSRSIKLKLDHQANLTVIAPPHTPKFLIDQFVKHHHDWIEKNQQKIHHLRAQTASTTDQNSLLLFGKTYTKKILPRLNRPIGITINDSDLEIIPVTESQTSIDRALTTFLKSTAEKYIIPRTQQLAQHMQIKYGSVTLRQQTSRWGSCSSSGNLNFNWRLVHCPPAVIDYVIIHELAHRRQMNHSNKFWDIVAAFDPEWQKHRGWLKRQGMALH